MQVQMDHEKLDTYPIELQFVAGGSVLAFYAGGRRETPIRDRGRGRGRGRGRQKALNPANNGKKLERRVTQLRSQFACLPVNGYGK